MQIASREIIFSEKVGMNLFHVVDVWDVIYLCIRFSMFSSHVEIYTYILIYIYKSFQKYGFSIVEYICICMYIFRQ